jgi:hypothetical protein
VAHSALQRFYNQEACRDKFCDALRAAQLPAAAAPPPSSLPPRVVPLPPSGGLPAGGGLREALGHARPDVLPWLADYFCAKLLEARNWVSVIDD